MLRSSFICLNMLQSLKDMLVIFSMCSYCFLKNTLSEMPKDLRRTIVCLFKNPALYLFQSSISRYRAADSCLQSYLIMLGLRWMLLLLSCESRTRIPFTPLYLIWTTLRFLIWSLRLIRYSKSALILPIPSVNRNYFTDLSSGIIF